MVTYLAACLVGVACLVGGAFSAPAQTSGKIDLLMPKVKPQQPDTYLCQAIKVEDAHRYITGYTPHADSMIAHHILLYGCEEPGQVDGTPWDCGEMAATKGDLAKGPVCRAGFNILYAWAMEAPKLMLPPDVGFDVGQATDVKYLVLQVHYKNVTKFLPPQNGDDSSGITLETTTKPTNKRAGVYLMSTGGAIPAHTVEYFEAACPFEEDAEIVPFAFRTHAHTLGRVISGYRIRDGEWTEIGRKDPRLPEMFYNATTPGITIKQGDILAHRCTMENGLDHEVSIGATQKDEMCNFYIMYYVSRPPLPTHRSCSSAGPPNWYWADYRDTSALNMDAMPDTVSVIPGSDKPLLSNATRDQSDFGMMSQNFNNQEFLYNYLQSLEEEEEEEEEEERQRWLDEQYYGQASQQRGIEPLDLFMPGV